MELRGKFANAFIHTNDVDQNTIDQVNNLINCDVSEGSTIHIMTDCHAGKGCTIGTTMTIKDRVCHNLVGCDVGCGILCLKVQGKFTVDDFLNACEKVPSGVGYIIEDGYLPYKPKDTIRIKEGYHNPLDAFGFFDDGPTVEMTPYGAMKALKKIISQKDKFEKCIEKSKRNSSLNKIQKFQHKLQNEF